MCPTASQTSLTRSIAISALLSRETIPSRRAVTKPLSQGLTHCRHVINIGGMNIYALLNSTIPGTMEIER